MTHEIEKPGAAELQVNLEGCLCQAEASKEWFDDKVLPLTIKQLRWRPEPQAWSIGECLDHLNLTLALYLPKVDDALARALREGKTSDRPPLHVASELDWIRPIDTPDRTHLCAPANTVPLAATDPERLVDDFHQSRNRYAEAVRRACGIALSSVLILEPIVSSILTLGGTLVYLAAHDRHHTRQAELVRRALVPEASIER